ncbi:MAG: hypothetical protein ACRD4L_04215 [Pyrinomonadaceae bacterium]
MNTKWIKFTALGLATVVLFTACNLNRTPTTASNSPAPTATAIPVPTATPVAETSPLPGAEPVEVVETPDIRAYQEGFEDGFRAAKENQTTGSVTTTSSGRSSGRSRPAQRVYYDYQPEKKQSFWSKHRDILTLAGGAGGGAILGGVIGGKKGAGIGALAGGAGSALYTYKLRKRN